MRLPCWKTWNIAEAKARTRKLVMEPGAVANSYDFLWRGSALKFTAPQTNKLRCWHGVLSTTKGNECVSRSTAKEYSNVRDGFCWAGDRCRWITVFPVPRRRDWASNWTEVLEIKPKMRLPGRMHGTQALRTAQLHRAFRYARVEMKQQGFTSEPFQSFFDYCKGQLRTRQLRPYFDDLQGQAIDNCTLRGTHVFL